VLSKSTALELYVDYAGVDVCQYAHTCPALLVTLDGTSAAAATAAVAAAFAVVIDQAQPAGDSPGERGDYASGVWCRELLQNGRYINEGAAIFCSVSWDEEEPPNRLPVTAEFFQVRSL
jgi:hypothetical protein